MELDRIVEAKPDKYERGSYGKVKAGFTPDPNKTFNRGYTELFMDGKRGKWAAMDAAKSMEEEIGTVTGISRDKSSINVRLAKKDIILNNGDGFSYVDKDGNVTGFRGDVCTGSNIKGKGAAAAGIGTVLFRNINSAFEKELERQNCTREIGVAVCVSIRNSSGLWTIEASAASEDGRKILKKWETEGEAAQNIGRMEDMIRGQLGKTTGIFSFIVTDICTAGDLPFMPASALNAMRREIALELENIPCNKKDILYRTPEIGENSVIPAKDVTYKTNISNNLSLSVYKAAGADSIGKAYELDPVADAELMRSRYCIRYELGICPVHHRVKDSGPLFLLNNGRRLALHFDCRNCEMTVTLP